MVDTLANFVRRNYNSHYTYMNYSSYELAGNPALPSFPTRRSSDLRHEVGQRPRKHRAQSEAGQIVAAVWRSEEHTSELQSRQYLVCRLLLEKKNKAESFQFVGLLVTLRPIIESALTLMKRVRFGES